MSAFKKSSHQSAWCVRGTLPLSASHAGRPAPSTLYRFSLFSTAKSFHFLLASWSRVSCCRQGPQLTSYFLQHLFLFGKADRDPESLETSHLLPSSAPFYPRSLESLRASWFFSFFSSSESRSSARRRSESWNGLAGKSQNHHLAEGRGCAG